MTILYRYSIRHPKRVLVAAVLCLAAIAPGMTRLRLRTDGNALLPQNSSEIKRDRQIRKTFGIKDQIVVLVESNHPDGVFNVETLRLVDSLTTGVQQLPQINPQDVISLATELTFRVHPGTLRFRRFLEPTPKTSEDLQRIRSDLRRMRLYSGTLVASDESATAIVVGVGADVDRMQVHRTLQRLIAELGEGPELVSVVGPPIAESTLGTRILQDLGVPIALLGYGCVDESAARPATMADWMEWVGQRVGLLPMAVATMFLVFLLAFRSITAAILPLVEVGACLLVVVSLMGWFGVPVYLTITVMPVILAATGIADEIHIFSRYRHLLRDNPSAKHVALVHRTMDEMWRPVLKTSVTTAIAFASFCLASLRPVQAFGLFTAVGIMFCLLWSITVVPASLAMISPGRFVNARRRGLRTQKEDRYQPLKRLATAVVTHRIAIMLLVLITVALSPFGISKLVVQDSWIDGFPAKGAFRTATAALNELFAGSHQLWIEARVQGDDLRAEITAADLTRYEVELPEGIVADPKSLVGRWITVAPLIDTTTTEAADAALEREPRRPVPISSATAENGRVHISTDRASGGIGTLSSKATRYEVRIKSYPLLDPKTLEAVCALERFIGGQQRYEVGTALGPCAYLETMNFMAHGAKEAYRIIPGTPAGSLRLWGQQERALGEHRRQRIINDDYSRCVVTVFMKNANYQAVKALTASIREYERTSLAPLGISLGFGGDVATSQALIAEIVRTQVRSLAASLLGILAVTTVMGRSVLWGLLCVLPCCLAVLTNFAVMGWMGIPLGVATSMFASMTLGIGVDYAIHLSERYRYMRRSGAEKVAATIAAITSSGPAIALDAIAVGLGFGILTVSQVPANARLGGLLVLSVLGCLVWTMALLPALLARDRN